MQIPSFRAYSALPITSQPWLRGDVLAWKHVAAYLVPQLHAPMRAGARRLASRSLRSRVRADLAARMPASLWLLNLRVPPRQAPSSAQARRNSTTAVMHRPQPIAPIAARDPSHLRRLGQPVGR